MKKLLSVLLALTVCVGLTIPAFAEPTEEVPVPEETLASEETVSSEETAISELPAPEVLSTLANLIAVEGELSGDGMYVMLGRQYGHFHADEDRDFDAEAAGILGNTEVTEGYVVLRPSYGRMCSDNSCPYNAAVAEMILESVSAEEAPDPGICPYCKDRNWGPGGIVDYKIRSVDELYHAESYIFLYLCNSEGCDGYCRIPVYKQPYEPHSWKKGSLVGYQSNASTHTATYNYSCGVCGETKTKPEASEPHSWDQVGTDNNSCVGSNHAVIRSYKCKCGETKTETESLMNCTGYTGDNYHRGTLHYVGYGYYCTACRYSETRYESMSCPGNNNGVGCVFYITHKVEPPVEELDVTEPEEPGQIE